MASLAICDLHFISMQIAEVVSMEFRLLQKGTIEVMLVTMHSISDMFFAAVTMNVCDGHISPKTPI